VVDIYKRFGGTCCPHLHGIPHITSKKKIFKVNAVRTSNYAANVMAFSQRKPFDFVCAVSILSHIREIQDSNPDLETGCSGEIFIIFLRLSRQMLGL
jgi:hypothetical protein